jgi:hypothetical protein
MPDDKTKQPMTWKGAVTTILIALISSGALSNWVGGVSGQDKAAETEKAMADYINDEVAPKIEEAFDAVDADLDAMDKDLNSCLKDAHDARVLADTAIRLLEAQIGARRVERTIIKVEEETPDVPVEPAPKATKHMKPRFKDYVQQQVKK